MKTSRFTDRQIYTSPAEPAQRMQLKHRLERGFSYSAPGVVAGGCKSLSSPRSRDWRASGFRSGGDGHIALSASGSPAQVIRYSQDSAGTNFKSPYGSISGFIHGLRSGSISPSSIKPIRIVNRDGKIFILDNRRLHSFEQAGVDIPYQKIDAIPKRDLFKFTTISDGTSILIRQGKSYDQ